MRLFGWLIERRDGRWVAVFTWGDLTMTRRAARAKAREMNRP